jgi:hypothetical protein
MTERHPKLFTYARWAYSRPAELWVHGGPRGHELLWSTTGVRQGDPIGHVLSSLGLQAPLREIVKDFLEVRIVAYLDDEYIQGPQGEVAQGFRRLCERWEAVGLVMATHQYKVWSLGNPLLRQSLPKTWA